MHNQNVRLENELAALQRIIKTLSLKMDRQYAATKKSIAALPSRREFNSRFEAVEGAVRRTAIAVVNLDAKTSKKSDELEVSMKSMESRLLNRMDSFMSATMRVDHDNILLVHRMDKIEGRVSSLERRSV